MKNLFTPVKVMLLGIATILYGIFFFMIRGETLCIVLLFLGGFLVLIGLLLPEREEDKNNE